MIQTLIVLPLVIPLLTAILCLLAGRRRRLQRWLSVLSAAALLAASSALLFKVSGHGIQVAHVGNWPAPYGITLVVDLFSATMLVLAGLIGLAVAVYSRAAMDAPRERFGYYPLLQILLMGVCGAFLTGDIFNLYVWFEVMPVASFVLVALGGERAQLEGAVKYVTLNLMSSALFLAAVGILYGVAGTLNMADLSVQLRQVAQPGLVTTVSVLFLIAFGIKAATFPLFFWLPASYHTPPVPIAAVFAGLLTKVGVYALIRVFTLIFVQDVLFTHSLILLISGLTMITGVLGAIAQNSIRRILSFHIVSQIGYMIMGLGLFTPMALAGSIFYIAHHIIVKTNLFLISGVTSRLGGTDELRKLGGMYALYPGLSVLFLIPALSLAGMPPLSGFWAKLALIQAGLAIRAYVIVGVALVVSLLTLFSMTKIWSEVFWKPAPEPLPCKPNRRSGQLALLLPIVGLAVLTVSIGLTVEPLWALATRAAEQLLDPAAYVGAVLGGS